MMKVKAKIRLLARYEAATTNGKIKISDFVDKLLKIDAWHNSAITSRKVQGCIQGWRHKGKIMFKYDKSEKCWILQD